MARKKKPRERAALDTFELAPEEKDRIYPALMGFGLRAGYIDPANADVYDPRENQRIPKSGAWAMIVRQLPPMERDFHEKLRVGRIFFLQHGADADDYGFRPDGTYKVMCQSPWGDVWLWPYEYATIAMPDLLSLWTAGEVVFHPLNVDQARFSEIAFYARSRGIGLGDAAVMALSTMTGPVGWFEPRPDLAEDCEALERSAHDPERYSFGRRRSITQGIEVS